MGEVSRGLLDTSVLIAHQDDVDVERSLPEEVSISVATLAELHYGVLVAKDDIARQHRLRRLGIIEATFHPIPIDAAVARSFAAVAHAVKAAGRQPRSRVMDLWIAATALTHRMPLYTRNSEDFEGLENLIEIRIGWSPLDSAISLWAFSRSVASSEGQSCPFLFQTGPLASFWP